MCVICMSFLPRERRRLGLKALKRERHKTLSCQQYQVKNEKASPCKQERVKMESVEVGLETQCTVGHKKATNHSESLLNCIFKIYIGGHKYLIPC